MRRATIAVPGELTFEYSDGSVTVRKTFRFDDTYVVGSRDSRSPSNGKPVQAYPSWPAGFGDQGTAPSFASARIDYVAGDKVERLAAKKISGGNTAARSVPVGWSAGPVLRGHLPARPARAGGAWSPSATRSRFPKIRPSPIPTT